MTSSPYFWRASKGKKTNRRRNLEILITFSQLSLPHSWERSFSWICREYGVLTPEDPYVIWSGEGKPAMLIPLFLLYDYSFRPDDIPQERALAWAEEANIICTDEVLLHPDPYPSRMNWCLARCASTEKRLQEEISSVPVVFINHFPMRQALVRLAKIPRFSLWCGTRRTEDWHRRFPTAAVVYGHVHMRATDYQDGVRFEEVSLGYPQQWQPSRGMQFYLREILPGPVYSNN
jgi:hypothetical protein